MMISCQWICIKYPSPMIDYAIVCWRHRDDICFSGITLSTSISRRWSWSNWTKLWRNSKQRRTRAALIKYFLLHRSSPSIVTISESCVCVCVVLCGCVMDYEIGGSDSAFYDWTFQFHWSSWRHVFPWKYSIYLSFWSNENDEFYFHVLLERSDWWRIRVIMEALYCVIISSIVVNNMEYRLWGWRRPWRRRWLLLLYGSVLCDGVAVLDFWFYCFGCSTIICCVSSCAIC